MDIGKLQEARDNNPDLSWKCREIVECDTARIDQFGDAMYLIIGFRKHTSDDPSSKTFINGEEVNYGYTDEKVVARGKSEDELLESAREYAMLCKMTVSEYVEHVTGVKVAQDEQNGTATQEKG